MIFPRYREKHAVSKGSGRSRGPFFRAGVVREWYDSLVLTIDRNAHVFRSQRQSIGMILSVFFVCAFFLSACGDAAQIPVVAHAPSQHGALNDPAVLVIAAIGDIMMPGSIQSAVLNHDDNYDILFEKVRDDLQTADIMIANLETPVDEKAPLSGYPRFNSSPGLLTALKRSGIDVVSVANNHVMDAGTAGLRRMLDTIDAAGLVFIGAGRTRKEAAAPRFLTVRGIRVAFLAFTYDVNQRLPRPGEGAPGVCVLHEGSEEDLVRAADQARSARANADILVVMLHWGNEYATEQTAWQRRAAAELAEAGADILFGSHPHVLQTVETISTRSGRRSLVAYSLGNFLSSQNAGIAYRDKDNEKALRGDGIILKVVTGRRKNGQIIMRAEFLPLWTLRERRRDLVLPTPAPIDNEIVRLEASAVRTREQEELLAFLEHRRRSITAKITGNAP